jgi:hypothetical protein
VSTSSFSSDEIRAAAHVHAELGPDYSDSVVEGFLERVNHEIDARVDARLRSLQPAPAPANTQHGLAAQQPAAAPAPAQPTKDRSVLLAVLSIVAGIPITGIVAGTTNSNAGAEFAILLVVWLAIAAINIAHVRHRP